MTNNITPVDAKEWFNHGINDQRREEILIECKTSEPDFNLIRDSYYYEIEAYIQDQQ